MRRPLFFVVHISGALHESFDTEDDAWEWVKQQKVCKDCLQELEEGGTWLEDPVTGEREWFLVDHVMDTHCGTEWLVLKRNEIESVREVASPKKETSMLTGFSYQDLVEKPDGQESFAQSIGRSLNVLLDLSLGLKALTSCEKIRIREYYKAECLECGLIVYLAPMKYLEA